MIFWCCCVVFVDVECSYFCVNVIEVYFCCFVFESESFSKEFFGEFDFRLVVELGDGLFYVELGKLELFYFCLVFVIDSIVWHFFSDILWEGWVFCGFCFYLLEVGLGECCGGGEDVILRLREGRGAICLLVTGFGELGMDVLVVECGWFVFCVFWRDLQRKVFYGCLSFRNLSVFCGTVVFSGVSCIVESFEDGVYGFLKCV